MKRGLFLFVLFLGWCGCSLFKNISTTTDKSHQVYAAGTNVKVTEDKDLKIQSNNLILFKDSGNAHFTIQIWPKGLFTYSAGKGFSGAADRMQIVETISGGSTYAGRSQVQQEDKGKVGTTVATKVRSTKNQQVKVKQSSPSWKWVVGGLGFMMILGLAWYLYHQLT